MTEHDPISPAPDTQIDPDPSPQAHSEAPPDHDPHDTAAVPRAEIPAEAPAPMIDIHPPQHGALTRRDFFIHLSTVILGILIAIGLEQTVEYLHHRYLAAEATKALSQERKQNEAANDFNIFATQHHERDLQHDLAMLDAVRAHRPMPPGPFILSHPTSLYNDEEWQNIHQTGAINYLGGNIAGGLRFRHTIEDKFADLSDRSHVDLARAASVLRTSSDPPSHTFEQNMAFAQFFRDMEAAHENLPQQRIDAAWATFAEPVNAAALSPAQIDSLERAIQIAIADDDAMLNACYTIKRNLVRNPGH
ncbi:MAG TPA: hypothetical protein VN612_05100 [Acidobacteriaceae bacterium]|nr:hypothetical protein [Acidobacteriaceae bacterium]